MCVVLTMQADDRRKAFAHHLNTEEGRHINRQVYLRHGEIAYSIEKVTRFDAQTDVLIKLAGGAKETFHLMPMGAA